jgi:hypothetical protein
MGVKSAETALNKKALELKSEYAEINEESKEDRNAGRRGIIDRVRKRRRSE